MISFLATVFKNKSTISFNHDLNLIEEVEKKEVVIYKINVPYKESDWVFKKIPFSGDIKFFIN